MREQQTPDGLRLSYRWVSGKVVWSLLGLMVLVAMTVGAVYAAQSQSGWLVKVAPVALGAITLLVGWGTLADLVNRTTIELTPKVLRVRHGPVRFGRRNHELDPAQIAQLFCQQRRTTAGADNISHLTHALVAVLRDGEQVTLIPSDPPDRLLYIEQQLEQALGIPDRPMQGERPRPGDTGGSSASATGR